MAKRGYTRDTIRGGASDWDVSRPFSSALRTLGSLVGHPGRFFEVLPKVPDVRAPGLFLAFSGVVSAVVWSLFGGIYAALAGLFSPLIASLIIALLSHLGTWGGRYDFVVTWRTVVYPVGFFAPLAAVPIIRWAAVFYAGVVLLSFGLATVREVSVARAVVVSAAITAIVLAFMWVVSGRFAPVFGSWFLVLG
ncbi:MAG: hypothetical protein H0U65_13785 [Rubrobacter sp.]|jgi:hypothetical protein|nr:hypothetical protein [Rubrobacter sp.]